MRNLVSRVPTSSAYWNLRAEQVMDKVFAQDAFRASDGDSALVAVNVDVEEPAANAPGRSDDRDHTAGAEQPAASSAGIWLIPLLSGLAVAGMVSSGWLIGSWRQSEAQLAQERNLRLIERLRTPAPAEQITAGDVPTEQPTPRPVEKKITQLSPPPPEPEWVTSLEPLTLPIRPVPDTDQISTPSTSTARPSRPITTQHPEVPLPQLTGVVQGPGGTSSAIFKLGQSSLSAGLGDGIGNSGWTLESISETGAVIQRDGNRRNLSVGGVF